MSSNPLNLLLRFVLELVMLFALGYWGWETQTGIWQVIAVIGLPLIAAMLWGTFRVPDDPKAAPVVVPGVVRLALELALFAAAVALLAHAGHPQAALILGLITAGHYVISYDRIIWLLTER